MFVVFPYHIWYKGCWYTLFSLIEQIFSVWGHGVISWPFVLRVCFLTCACKVCAFLIPRTPVALPHTFTFGEDVFAEWEFLRVLVFVYNFVVVVRVQFVFYGFGILCHTDECWLGGNLGELCDGLCYWRSRSAGGIRWR